MSNVRTMRDAVRAVDALEDILGCVPLDAGSNDYPLRTIAFDVAHAAFDGNLARVRELGKHLGAYRCVVLGMLEKEGFATC